MYILYILYNHVDTFINFYRLFLELSNKYRALNYKCLMNLLFLWNMYPHQLSLDFDENCIPYNWLRLNRTINLCLPFLSTQFRSMLSISFYIRVNDLPVRIHEFAHACVRPKRSVAIATCSANNSDLRLLTRGTWTNVITSPYRDSVSARWPGSKAKRKANVKSSSCGSIREPLATKIVTRKAFWIEIF